MVAQHRLIAGAWCKIVAALPILDVSILATFRRKYQGVAEMDEPIILLCTLR